ncbi:hypothetical protein [uncultured Kocuria sp.]|uniref:hypothetical protein n=1 Tax=uncultured Kocuria sp. TaxID=259305 RepID=UPI002630917A|nr:hypothetical protein [uncultured Kocuria sp.]
MDHKLSVLVQVDLDGAYVRLVVTGCLTGANHHVLYPLVRRARTLIPPVTVTVDLTTAGHVEEGAVDLLRWALEHDGPTPGAGPAKVLAPVQVRAHRPARRHVPVPDGG